MRKIFIAISIAALAALASCSEWEPVVTINYDDPGVAEPVNMTANCTIAELKAKYKTIGEPVKIDDDLIICGQVASEDRSGNIYKSLYLQDATGGIELKIGKSALYNDYKPGQWVYVKCEGLTLGNYSGMLQIGYGRNKKASGEESGTNDDGENSDDYETTYIDVQYIIDTHIFKGKVDSPVTPKVLTEEDLIANLKARHPSGAVMPQQGKDFGTLVTLKGLKYGNEVFALLYPDPDQAHDKDHPGNRVFLSDKTWNITSWALTKQGFINHLNTGDWDEAATGDDAHKVKEADLKALMIRKANAYSVSQYFKLGSTNVQVRTSGFSRFADSEIDPDVLAGNATIDVTGILCCYLSSGTYVIQFTLIDEDSVVINK